MKLPTFSRWPLAAVCPAHVAFPHAERSTSFAALGTSKHGFHENVGAMSREEALSLVPPEHRAACERMNLDRLPWDPKSYSKERAFALNIDTFEARDLGTGLGRKYPDLGPRWTYGTLDVVGLAEDAVLVADLKTGWSDTTPAREHWQLRMGALAAARAFGKTTAHVAIIHVRDDGEPYWDTATFSELDLDATEHSVRRVVAQMERAIEVKASGEDPTVTAGAHCARCPALGSCPASREVILATIGRTVVPVVLNEETAPILYARLLLLDEVRDLAWKVLDGYAEVSPIPAGNGYVYGATKVPRTTINGEKAPELLKRIGLTVEPEVKKVITHEALKDAIRREWPNAKITKAHESLIAQLLEAGAASTTTTTSVRKHKAKPPALPAETNPQSEETDATH